MKLLQSKLSIPELAQHIVDRSRLKNNILNNEQADLFVFNAPAGFGKTVLALQVLGRIRSQDKGWYHLEKCDANPSRFLSYFVEALPSSFIALKQAGITPSDPNISKACDDICFFFKEYRGPQGWLVLDNWENVNNNRDITECISRLIPLAQGKLKLIITSRVKPKLKTKQLSEQVQAVFLTQDDLCFNIKEFSEVIRCRTGQSLDESTLEEFWRLTGGWCVGVGLMAEISNRRKISDDPSDTYVFKTSKAFSEYIEEELLSELPHEFADFLICCSVLDRLTVEGCQTVGYEDDCVRHNLSLLSKSGIPHTDLPDGGGIRLHPLIRSNAIQLLKLRKSATDVSGIYLSTAEFFKSQGMILEAIELLIESNQFEAALSEMSQHDRQILGEYGTSKSEELLDRIPEHYGDHILMIQNRVSVLICDNKWREVTEYISSKSKALANTEDHLCQADIWLSNGFAKSRWFTKPLYDEICDAWKEFCQRHGPLPNILRAQAENLLAATAMQEVNYRLAVQHAENCLSLLQGQPNEILAIPILNRAIYKACSGRALEALKDLDLLYAECISRGQFMIALLALNRSAFLQAEVGYYKESLRTVERCLTLMSAHNIHNDKIQQDMWSFRSQAYWYLGRHKQAISLLIESSPRSNPSVHQAASLLIMLEFYQLLTGKPVTMIEKSNIHGDGFFSHLYYLAKESVRAIIYGNNDDIYSNAVKVLELASRGGGIPWVVTANFLLAYWADRTGKPEQSVSYLKIGLERLDNIGYRSYPMACDLVTSFVLVKAVKHDVLQNVAARLVTGDAVVNLIPAFENEFNNDRCSDAETERLLAALAKYKVNGLAKTLNRLQGKDSPILARCIDAYNDALHRAPLTPLEIHTLGRFEVLAGGKEITFARKKSKLLFQVLLSSFPKPLHEKFIWESLWPQSTPEKGKRRLYNCLSSLRHALNPFHESGQDTYIEHSDNHYKINLPEGSFYDADRLLLAISDRKWYRDKNDAPSAKDIEEFYSTLLLYNGEFLPGQPFDRMVTEYRELLREEYQKATLRFADLLSRTDNSHRAIAVLEAEVKRDLLWRDGVKTLMSIYVNNSRLLDALRLYRNYEEFLAKDINLPPDEELVRYFESLTRPTEKLT